MKRVAVVISSVLFFRVSDMQSAPGCNFDQLVRRTAPHPGRSCCAEPGVAAELGGLSTCHPRHLPLQHRVAEG